MTMRRRTTTTTGEDVALIREVRGHDVIYDYSLTAYKDSENKSAAWQQIAASLGLTEIECRNRWRNLRDTFVKNTRKQDQAIESGSDDWKEWKHMSAMSFLKPHVQERRCGWKREPSDCPVDGALAESGGREGAPWEAGEEGSPGRDGPPPAKAPRAARVPRRPSPRRDTAASAPIPYDDVDHFFLSLIPAFRRLHPRYQMRARIRFLSIIDEFEEIQEEQMQ